MAVAALLAGAVAAIAFALQVTPLQSVTVLGQTVKVGTVAPSPSLSGPARLDLFGQSISTTVHFPGLVRPRLVLAKISVNDQVTGFLTHGDDTMIGERLADGWRRYFAWEAGFVAVGAAVMAAAYLGVRPGSTRRPWRLVVTSVVVAEAVNFSSIVLMASGTSGILARMHSLTDLVGRSRQAPVAAQSEPPRHDVQAVVLGDSTAAGLGGPLVANASDADRACHRSSDAYAVDLALANGWKVENLACSGATIADGLLTGQSLGTADVPAQVAAAKRAVDANVIVVSVGANDLNWDGILQLCAVATTCDDSASTAFFQRNLHQFTEDYYGLLEQLAAFPGKPRVIVNRYYVPFDPTLHCMDPFGLGSAKQHVLLNRLGDLNAVLQRGADAFHFQAVQPDFAGHELCTMDPYVQGPDDAAPFHPTASGELAIALADQAALTARP
ncbi:MAG TPA: SGNH/GDSL hydrolase family protein [Acidimicrobiales bacterium]